MNRQSRSFWTVVTLVFLLIAAARLLRLNDLTMNRDEIWSIWQTLGTPQQIIQWTPYDWPPGYYLILGAWRGVAGSYPVALRMLSALTFLIGAACMFRLMRRWRGWQAGVIAALAYGALSFGIQLSLEVRGYALLMALMPVALWLAVRYFDYPIWRRALALALVLAAMFYISLTSFGAFLIIGLFTLLVYGRKVWRWWLPGGIAAVLAAPEIIAKSQLATSRVVATQTLTLPPLPEALLKLFSDYTGFGYGVWGILAAIGVVGIVYRGRSQLRHAAALLVWVIGMPLALYLSNPVLGFFSVRYAWWMIPGIALLIGWGWSLLPRLGVIAAGAAMAGLMFVPLPTGGPYQIWDVLSPLNENFAWLRDNMQWGDVVLTTTGRHTCGNAEEWDYYLQLYFPTGLRFVPAPDTHRRIWVLNPEFQPDEVQAALAQNYLQGRFVGPPGCLFRLYEAPPDAEGMLFENGMRFHGVDVMDSQNPFSGPLVRREGETIRLRLWWSVDEPPELDYSRGLYLRRSARIFDQLDGPPEAYFPPDAPGETSRWQPGTYYVEEQELTLPFPAAGVYAASMTVYFWADPTPFAASDVDEDGHLRLLTVEVQSY